MAEANLSAESVVPKDPINNTRCVCCGQDPCKRQFAEYARPLLTWDHPQTHDCWPHEWALENRTPPGVPTRDSYWCVVCSKCRGARCVSMEKPFRCEQIRHHRSPHLYGNGDRREVGA